MKSSRQIALIFLVLAYLPAYSSCKPAREPRSLIGMLGIAATLHVLTMAPNAYEWALVKVMNDQSLLAYVRLFCQRETQFFTPTISIVEQEEFPERLLQHFLLDYIYESTRKRFCFVHYHKHVSRTLSKSARYQDEMRKRLERFDLDQSSVGHDGTISVASGYKECFVALAEFEVPLKKIRRLIVTSYSFQDQLYAYQLEHSF